MPRDDATVTLLIVGDGGTDGKVDSGSIELRAATADDDAAVLQLLQASMGWVPDELSARFFEWKHRHNPAGRSPAWVATDAGRIVGFRTFLRWRFDRGHGEPVEAVRAVDTATHPDYQGRGIFSRLTRRAIDELTRDGVGFVFNTPNERSRPGYLKLGWQEIGRLPVAVRPRGLGSLARLARARTPAEKWSLPSDAGVAAPEAFADEEAMAALLAACRVPEEGPAASTDPGRCLSTVRRVEHLRWRYGFPELHYRTVVASGGASEGLVVFRLRRRGGAVEAAVCELLTPADDWALARELLSRTVRESRADYSVLLGTRRGRLGTVPLPRQGPLLVWRSLSHQTPPALADWKLSLGDVELF